MGREKHGVLGVEVRKRRPAGPRKARQSLALVRFKRLKRCGRGTLTRERPLSELLGIVNRAADAVLSDQMRPTIPIAITSWTGGARSLTPAAQDARTLRLVGPCVQMVENAL